MASSYTTKSGDMWDGVSYLVYGSSNYVDLLMDANPEHVYTVRFDAGVELDTPELPTPDRPSSLPPWKIA